MVLGRGGTAPGSQEAEQVWVHGGEQCLSARWLSRVGSMGEGAALGSQVAEQGWVQWGGGAALGSEVADRARDTAGEVVGD